jgi:hypothetical protein
MANNKLLIIPFLISLYFVFFAYMDIEGSSIRKSSSETLEKEMKKFPPIPMNHIAMKDTIYVKGNNYVIIDLKQQLCSLIHRDNAKNKVYKISSGNPNLPLGIETTTGLFTVQTKNPLGHSKQFENAELHNWIGFNVNIGLHGLAGNGYYGTLGVRPSSHGCVRISREDGKELYQNVDFGTPVLVYKNAPAVELSFLEILNDTTLNSDTSYKKSISDLANYKPNISNADNMNIHYQPLPSDARTFKAEMHKRQTSLYQGLAFVQNKTRLLLDGQTIIRWGGYPIGNADNIPFKQKIINPINNNISPAISDVLIVNRTYLEPIIDTNSIESTTQDNSKSNLEKNKNNTNKKSNL